MVRFLPSCLSRLTEPSKWAARCIQRRTTFSLSPIKRSTSEEMKPSKIPDVVRMILLQQEQGAHRLQEVSRYVAEGFEKPVGYWLISKSNGSPWYDKYIKIAHIHLNPVLYIWVYHEIMLCGIVLARFLGLVSCGRTARDIKRQCAINLVAWLMRSIEVCSLGPFLQAPQDFVLALSVWEVIPDWQNLGCPWRIGSSEEDPYPHRMENGISNSTNIKSEWHEFQIYLGGSLPW